MTSVALLHRVEDVLHVHEDRDSIHGVTCLSPRQKEVVALILVDQLVSPVNRLDLHLGEYLGQRTLEGLARPDREDVALCQMLARDVLRHSLSGAVIRSLFDDCHQSKRRPTGFRRAWRPAAAWACPERRSTGIVGRSFPVRESRTTDIALLFRDFWL